MLVTTVKRRAFRFCSKKVFASARRSNLTTEYFLIPTYAVHKYQQRPRAEIPTMEYSKVGGIRPAKPDKKPPTMNRGIQNHCVYMKPAVRCCAVTIVSRS